MMGERGDLEGASAPLPAPAFARALAWARSIPTFPIHLFVATRVVLCLTSWFGLRMVPALYMHEASRQPTLREWAAFDGLCRWDCGWFVRIVQEGYATPEHAKVFPLFPLIGYWVERVTHVPHIVVFLVVANAASLASYFVMYELFKELDGEPAARAALVLFAAYPFAFFQAAAYPESSMILATSSAILLARRGHHLSAGVALGLGTMARHLTLSGGAALIVAHVRQRGRNLRALLLDPSLLGLLVPWLFIAAFGWYLKRSTGDALAFWTSRQVGWNHGEPWWGVRQIFQQLNTHDHSEFYAFVLVATVPTLGTLGLFRNRKYAELAAHSAILMAVILTSGAAALGRYSASAWPAFLPLGVFLEKRPNLFGPVVLAFALFQGMFFFLFSHQFKIL